MNFFRNNSVLVLQVWAHAIKFKINIPELWYYRKIDKYNAYIILLEAIAW